MATEGNDAPGPQAELIVVAHPEAVLQVHGTKVQGAVAAEPLERALAETRSQARPLFGASEERIRARQAQSPWDLPDLSTYYRVTVDDDEPDHEAVAARLNEEESIAGAFLKAPVQVDQEVLPPSTEADASAALAVVTADFVDSHQLHLVAAAAGGCGAKDAWTKPGGTGTNVVVAIVGGAWRNTHEDLGGIAGQVGGQAIDSVNFRNHGTAVAGLIRANHTNGRGMAGIAPTCQLKEVATFGLGTAAAVRFAADALPAGGVLVIEWQRPGPGSSGSGSAGFLPLEWWPDDFAAIQYATQKGVVVVEPAGNGSVSLDDPFYNTPAPGFPATWKNPFQRAQADCGAILVGAGAPPPGTHGNTTLGPDRSRLPTSNYGAAVDTQGWGAELATLGYGDLQGGPDENVWYTARFGGTSGAAAMVGGVVASLQSMQLGGQKRPPLTPADVRQRLRTTGPAQQDAPDRPAATNRIGNRPDLIALFNTLVVSKDENKENKDGKDGKDNKESKDNKDSKESNDKLTKDNKDNKESKENKDSKDNKDDKEGKEKEVVKDRIDNKLIPKENEQPLVGGQGHTPVTQVPLRTTTEPVAHFIPQGLRPDLTASHLTQEPEFEGRPAAEVADELRPPADQPAETGSGTETGTGSGTGTDSGTPGAGEEG
jgi:hypothetical protein